MNRFLTLATALAACASCMWPVPPSNPYDPGAPAEQQQKAAIPGIVSSSVDGRPLPGALVELAGPATPSNSPSTTASDGIFRFDGLTPGSYVLNVTHPGHFGAARVVDLAPGQSLSVNLTLQALPAGTTESSGHLTGTIHKAGELNLTVEQQDHAGVLVEVVGASVRTTTNPQGLFDLFLSPGTYDVNLSAADHRSQVVSGVVVASGGTFELSGSALVLAANPGNVSGVVTLEGADAGGFDGINVALVGGPSTTTASDGSFLLTGVAPGVYTLQASRVGFDSTSMVGVVVRGGRATPLPSLDLMRSRGRLTGSVKLTGSSDAGGVVVELSGTSHATVTAQDGRFALVGVPVGSYSVVAHRSGWIGATASGINIVANGDTDAGTLVLAPDPGQVSGKVLLEGQSDHSGVALSLNPGNLTETSSTDGGYTFGDVVAGTYLLSAAMAGYKTSTLQVVAVAGRGVTVPSVRLLKPRGTLIGLVQVEGGSAADIEAVRIDLISSGFNSTSPPGSTGNYQLADVPTGTYSVIARLSGFASARADGVVVTEDNVVSVPTLLLRRSGGDFQINGGAAFTTSPAVTLQLDNATAVDMRVSEDATFNDSTSGDTAYVAYNATPGVSLTSGDGNKTIYVQYRDGVGTESAVFSSSIILDTQPPIAASVSINDDADYTNATPAIVNLSLNAVDATTSIAWVMVSPNADFSSATWVPYQRSLSYTIPGSPPAQGTHRVYARFRDAAGNAMDATDAAADTIEYDTMAPPLTGLTVDCGGVTNPLYCNDTRVTVSIAPNSNEPTASMALSNTGSFGGATFTGFTPSVAWELTPGDGQKTVYLQLRDAAGNSTTGLDNDTIILDTIAPTLSASLSGPGLGGPSSTLINDGSKVTVTLNGLDETTAKSALLLQISNYPDFTDGAGNPVAWATYQDVTSNWSVRNPAVSGSKTVYVRLKDLAGNIANNSATIDVDARDPVLYSASFAEGALTNTASVTLNVSHVGADELRLRGPVDKNNQWLPAAPRIPVTLTGVDGAKSILVDARDASGRMVSLTTPAVITLDRQGPTAMQVTIRGNIANGATSLTLAGSTSVTLELQATGASWVKLSNQATLSDAAWQPFTTDPIAWQLLPGDSATKTVHAQFRDDAGNSSAVVQGVTRLDTTPPAPATLVLAGGADFANELAVSLSVSSSEPLWSVSLSGDIAETGNYVGGAYPGTVTLQGTDGTKLVSAVILDAAGNASLPVTAVVTLDRAAPADGTVVLAGGQTSVSSDVVSVQISDTAPDSMRLWEVGSTATCGAPACGTSGYVPFSSATTFSLSAGTGSRKVCWRFCDNAGNASNVGSTTLSVTASTPRPTPILSSVSPTSYLALSNEGGAAPRYPLTITGRGIAGNTRALIGNFTLPCASTGATECVPDADDDACKDSGSCGSHCECGATCATSCVVDLPDDIMRSVGSYVVRLDTPAPVVGGVNTSTGTARLNIVAPLPEIDRITPRGVVQAMATNGHPVGQSLIIEVWGTNFMDNVQFRLGSNYGQVLEFAETGLKPATRYAKVRIATDGLYPRDLQDYALAAINPSPGGGETQVPFGLSPVVTSCAGDCTSNLRNTRAPLANGRALGQSFDWETPRDGGFVWQGGTAARIVDASGNLMTRVTARANGSALPLLPLPGPNFGGVQLESSLGDQPRVLLSAGAGVGAGTFTDAGSVATGVWPFNMAFADLDGDGWVDVAVGNNGDNSVSILRNDNGTLIPWNKYPSGGRSPGVALGDISGDGIPDLISVATSGVGVRLGNGDGTFAERFDWPGGARSVAIGDVNDDGHPDILSTSSTVYFGAGGGAIGSTGYFGGAGYHVVLADVDNDGVLDAVGDGPTVALGNGDGTFTTRFVGPAIYRYRPLAVGDLNLDGALDIVADNPSGGFLVYMGDGTGGFDEHSSQPVVCMTAICTHYHDGMALGDLNGDGVLDLVAVGAFDGPTYRLGAGDGTFGPLGIVPNSLSTNNDAHEVRLFDIDQDGALDILAANRGGNSLHVWKNDLAGTLGGVSSVPQLGPPARQWSVAAADMNQDGVPDLLFSTLGANARIAYGSSNGAFSTTELPSLFSRQAVQPIDVNGDGVPDVASGYHSTLSVSLQGPIGSFAASVDNPMTGYPSWLQVTDFNNDSIPDIVMATFSNNVAVVLGQGSSPWFAPAATHAAGTTVNWVAVGDVNLDGNMDIATSNNASRDMTVLLGDGTGAFNEASGSPYPMGSNQPQSITLADLNNDGILDAIVAAQNSLWMRYGDGTGGFGAATTHDVSGITFGQDFVQVVDWQGDGHADLLVSDTFGNDIYLALGDGAGNFTATRRPSGNTGLAVSLAADINGDGALDILTPSTAYTTSPEPIGVHWGATPRPWTQELTDMPAASVVAPPGMTTSFTVHQTGQFLHDIVVRALLDGTDYAGVGLSLLAPDGTLVSLDDETSHTGGTRWTGHYTKASTAGLGDLAGRWMPAGDWTLQVENTGGVAVGVLDFAMILRGQFSVMRGREPELPETIHLVSGKRHAVVHGTTLGFSNSGNASCSSAPGVSGPDHWYELDLPAANKVRARLVSAVDLVVEIRSGACAYSTPVACDVSSGYGRNPTISSYQSLPAGPICVLVDGYQNATETNQGDYDLWIELETAML